MANDDDKNGVYLATRSTAPVGMATPIRLTNTQLAIVEAWAGPGCGNTRRTAEIVGCDQATVVSALKKPAARLALNILAQAAERGELPREHSEEYHRQFCKILKLSESPLQSGVAVTVQAVADATDVQAFWTEVMVSEDVPLDIRLAASKLLGQAKGLLGAGRAAPPQRHVHVHGAPSSPDSGPGTDYIETTAESAPNPADVWRERRRRLLGKKV